jgi:serine/threonine protein kinase
LNNKHIVKLHGVTAGSVESNVATGKECGFFIIVDRLFDTLEKKIEYWKEDAERHHGNVLTRLTNDFKEKRRAALVLRLKIAIEVAEAMIYLHSLDIIYRDLKVSIVYVIFVRGFTNDLYLTPMPSGFKISARQHRI